jgi:hypothetical protein
MRVAVTGSNSAGSSTATSAATAQVTAPTPPAPGGRNIVLNDQPFVCNGPVDYDLVKVTMRTSNRDAISLAAGCTGRIGRIEVESWTQDGVKVQNGTSNPAHDIVIGGGYVKCHDIAAGAHQDAMQAMAGTRITFRNVTFDCLGHSNFFVAVGGGGQSTPTDVVCENCVLGPNGANAARIADSMRSGLRNTLGCRSYRYGDGLIFMSSADNEVNVGNAEVNPNDARCQNL